MQLHNFNSGPSILPQEVLEQSAAAIHNFNGTGLSILEIGHRTSAFVEVVQEAQSIIKKLMGIGDEYEVLFLQGGATMQFMQVPMNLLDEHGVAAICDNGVWGNKAVKEARNFGPVVVASDTSDKKHTDEQYDKQDLSDKQKESLITWSEVLKIYNNMKKYGMILLNQS